MLRFQSPMLRPSLSTVTTQVIKEGFVLRGTVTQYPEGGPSADYYQLTRFRFCWFDDDGDRTCANATLSQPEPEKHVIHLEYTLGSDQLSPGASYQVQIEVGLGDETMSMMSGPATPLPSL